MMGVYIEGFQLPEKSDMYYVKVECEAGKNPVATIWRKDLLGEMSFGAFEVVPVPPHGRLIDADALLLPPFRQGKINIEIMKEKINLYNEATDEEEKKKLYLEILYSNPTGFCLTARMTTNYRCLRNIYIQRKDHRLPEWRAFCKWIETLPYAEELLIN